MGHNPFYSSRNFVLCAYVQHQVMQWISHILCYAVNWYFLLFMSPPAAFEYCTFQAFNWIFPLSLLDHIHCNKDSWRCWHSSSSTFAWRIEKSWFAQIARRTLDVPSFVASLPWSAEAQGGVEDCNAFNGYAFITISLACCGTSIQLFAWAILPWKSNWWLCSGKLYA